MQLGFIYFGSYCERNQGSGMVVTQWYHYSFSDSKLPYNAKLFYAMKNVALQEIRIPVYFPERRLV